MQAQLLGVQYVDFKNNSGETISGTNIFVAYKESGVEGMRAEKYFLKEGITLPKDIKLNSVLELSFNRKGKIEAVYKAN
jgi:hypothetical protein